MKSQLAEVQTGFEPLFFHIQADFQWQRPFSEGCGGEIPEKTKKNLSQSYGRWIVGFHEPMTSAFFALKKGATDWRYDSVFWALPVSTQWHIYSECLSSNTNKKPAQILRFAESKKEPLFRKILGKAAQNAVGKGTGPSNLPKPILASFCHASKNGRKKARKSFCFPS